MTVVEQRQADVEVLDRAWRGRTGVVGFFTAVNHKQIGLRFIVTAFGFLLVGGIEAMLIRTQLLRPENGVLDAEAYNQLFTMHGTTMMFLFAVPILEGLAMYLVPLMIGTRDLPFPRLNAFGYWAYLLGGVLLNWSFLTGSVPDTGWFAYTPLSGPEFSPTRSMDFWLLGVTFVEIAGIVGALELVVVILRQRAPGMSLLRMPLFVWSILVMAAMMLVAFPAVIGASLLLELERKVGAPFYDPSQGGNPLLWQHLFWIFGHPEVYIMLLPATGMVSSIVAVGARRPIVGYGLVVAALVATGIISFGLWVHHMFTVGVPVLAQMLFAVASAAIAIPAGIQVFAWIATIWQGRPRWRTPMLYVVGFFLTFVAGGISGVMVAAAPFDWQVHDTYFVVAHFHYVILGGVVFPVLGALHHWFPKMTGKLPSEGAGRVSFALVFVGFHIAFFPQHIVGLLGMPRRVYTYDSDFGWEWYNLVSTLGAYLLAVGVLVFTVNLAHAWWRGARSPDDPWEADTLEWSTSSPPASYNFAELPVVSSVVPRWEPAGPPVQAVSRAVATLAAPEPGVREVLHTSPQAGRLEGATVLPGPTIWPLWAALAVGVALVGALIDALPLGILGVVATVVSLVGWTRTSGQPEGAAGRLPGTAPRRSAGWWGFALGLLSLGGVVGSLLYAYYYLSVTATQWPPAGVPEPSPGWAVAGGGLIVAGAVVAGLAGRAAAHGQRSRAAGHLVVAAVAGLAAAGATVVEVGGLAFSIDDHGYGAAFVTLLGMQVLFAAIAAVLSVVVAAWLVRGSVPASVATVRIVSLWWWFVAGAVVVSLAVLHLSPRVL